MKYNELFKVLRSEEDGEGGDGGGGETTGNLLEGAGDVGASSEGSAGSKASDEAAAAVTAAAAGSSDVFDFRQLINDEGNFQENWTDNLPENLKEHSKHFSKYKSPIHALEHTRNLQQLLGKKSEAVVIPSQDAPKEEWDEFRSKLGVPDSPEGYGLKVPDDLPSNLQASEEDLKAFSGLAHEIGLTPQQVAKLQEYDTARFTGMADSSEQQAHAIETKELEDNKKALSEEWGSELTAKLTLAKRAAVTFGYTGDQINENPIFRNAEVIKILAKAGGDMGEDRLASGDDGSPTSLKSRAQDIINNTDNPEYKKYWDGDEATGDKVRNWMRS